MSETFTAYVTRYALSSGILKTEAVQSSSFPEMISDTKNRGRNYHGKDWHRTPEAAIVRADEMRKAKIASLEKSITKLRKLKFEVLA